MSNEILEKLDAIQERTQSGSLHVEIGSNYEWRGADVIICSEMNDEISKWLGDSHPVISLQKSEPQRRIIITQYSKELSWLFVQLRDAFSESIDFSSKYDFYGSLAQAAIDYLKDNSSSVECNGLLLEVLDEARKMTNEFAA
ncbi:MAG: hypothetical protein ACYC0L_08280 [Thermoleophilia bacterium]